MGHPQDNAAGQSAIDAVIWRLINENKAPDHSFSFGDGSPIHLGLGEWLRDRPETRDPRREAMLCIEFIDRIRQPGTLRDDIPVSRMEAAFDRIVDQNTGPDGRFNMSHGSAIHEQYAEWFQARPELRNPSLEALVYLQEFDHAHRPDPRNGRSCGDPGVILPIDDTGGRVLGSEASDEQAEQCLEFFKREVERQRLERERELAHRERLKAYIDSRLAAFESPEQTLLDVEMTAFGYQQDPERMDPTTRTVKDLLES